MSMSYARALAALDARQETRIELGLERVKAHLARLGDPQERVPMLHVAGTNGKGSTCAMMGSILSAAGKRVGLYTSPHLLDLRERIRVGGRAISRGAFARLMERTLSVESADARLTYFELLTVVAFLHFAETKCDVVVLETGLGGRLDATNVVEKPLVTVITSIGYDHMSFLGDTLGKIAGEKAGIAKKGVPLVCAKLPAEAMRVVRAAAKRAGAPLTTVGRPWPRTKVEWASGKQGFTAPFGAVKVNILGEKQGMNAAVAYTALRRAKLGVTDSSVRVGLRTIRWPLRFEVLPITREKRVIVDGAHNGEAAANFARTWSASPFSASTSLFILGILRDKDVDAVLTPLAPFVREAVAVAPPSPRAMPAQEFAALLRKRCPRAAVTTGTAAGALRAWKAKSAAPTAVVLGSLYLAAAAARSLGVPSYAA